jgi:Response regulators consisting of a CheY-like receiver domain and a winged-helix DNA-binding domain
MAKQISTADKTSRDEIDRYSVLIAQQGPLEGQRWNIAGEITIGRAPECEIQIPDRQVSRYHARIFLDQDLVELEDLGSKNGTFIGNKELEGKVDLTDGTIFQVALVQKFVYYISDATMPLEDLPALEIKKHTGIYLDKKSRRVWVGNKELTPPLSVPQFKLLEVMYEAPGMVISRDELVSQIWANEQSEGVSDQALDALIRRLRDRLTDLDPDFEYIITVRGHGLRFQNR